MSYIYVSEEGMCYCEDCAPDDAAPYPFSESDLPSYCEECGELLDESYTDYAIGYIKREIMPDLWRLIKTKGPDTPTGPPHWIVEHTARERWDELRDILYRYKSLSAETQTTINGPYAPTNLTLKECWDSDLGQDVDYALLRANADPDELEILEAAVKDDSIDVEAIEQAITARVLAAGRYVRDGKWTREAEAQMSYVSRYSRP